MRVRWGQDQRQCESLASLGIRLTGPVADSWTNLLTRHLWIYTPRDCRFVRLVYLNCRGMRIRILMDRLS